MTSSSSFGSKLPRIDYLNELVVSEINFTKNRFSRLQLEVYTILLAEAFPHDFRRLLLARRASLAD